MAIRGAQSEQVGWYEAALPLNERKSRGHFSTPPLLVERILDACSYTSDNDLSGIHVLDPACGSGNFLAGVARRLVSFGTRTNLSLEALTSLISRNVWGFDPDPISCFLAEMQLSAIDQGAMNCIPTRFHIHQADGLALPWHGEPCVDLFLANPPYLAAKNIDLSGYRTARQHGQADSYLLFLNLGLQIVRPNGWLGLVLPDPLLARTNAAKERTRLLNECTIHHLWHLSNVFAAEVGAVVIIAQKCPPKSTHQVSWIRGKWKSDVGAQFIAPREHHLPQSLFHRQPGGELRYLLGSEQGSIVERLRACFDETSASSCRRFAPLSEFVSIRRGEELGKTSSLLVHQNVASIPGRAQGIAPKDPSIVGEPCLGDRQESLGGSHTMLCARPVAPNNEYQDNNEWYPVLRGGRDVRPYGTHFSGWWIAREAITKPLERYLSAKLLVVKSTDRLQAALDTQGHIALQTLYLLHLRGDEASEGDLYFFLALLNSRLLRTYVYMLYTAYKWVQPQLEQHVLARLPIPIISSAEKQQIINTAKLLVHACSEIGPVVEWKEDLQSMYEEQERAICALYTSALL